MKALPVKKNKSGFTLVELLIVIVVLGILSAIAIPMLSGINKRSKINVDKANLRILNESTRLYAINNNINTEDIFEEQATDSLRMQVLIDNTLLTEILKPKQKKTKFKWIIADQWWNLRPDSIVYDTSGKDGNFNIQNLLDTDLKINAWEKNSSGGINSKSGGKEQLIFTKNDNEEYIITSRAKLSEEAHGGYGVFFDTAVNTDTKEDSGYILQFDRGYAGGSIIVRERKNGSDSGYKVTKILDNSGVDALIQASGSDSWWTDRHDIKLQVSKTSRNNKELTVYIDNTKIGSPFLFESNTSPDNNYTGFRSWGKTSNFTGLEIEGK